jgi:2'-hydroxyisoflavone reductase
MDILFIGGTRFVGRAMAEEALARGHHVALFHRGRSGADLFPEAEHLLGDRHEDLDVVKGRTWDAVVDVCAYVPAEVHAVADAVADAGRYCYISSVSAYRMTGASKILEESPLLGPEDLDDPQTETVDWQTYGPLEAMCEAAALERFDERATIVRPTYVVGPYDTTDRFTYWVRRAASGGIMFAAGPADAPFQAIDVRDLGAFTIGLVEQGLAGAFNGVGPMFPITWADLLRACISASSASTSVRWADAEFLKERGVEIEVEFPMWAPPDEFEAMRADTSKSVAAGLELRPLADSIRDTFAWDVERGLPPLKDALTTEREAELLAAWRAR